MLLYLYPLLLNNIKIITKYIIRFLLLSVLTSSSIDFVFANNKLDSLRQELSEAQEDTSKISLLNAFAKEMSSTNYDMASLYGLQALALSKQLEEETYQAKSHFTLGSIESQQQNFLKSIDYFDRAREIFEKLEDDYGIARSYNELGISYDYLGNYTKALECYLVPLRIYKSLDYKSGIANSYNNVGVIYYYQASYNEARRYFDLAIELYREIGDIAGEAIEYNNIGNIYSDQGNYDEALTYYFKGLEIDRNLNDVSGESVSLVNIGDIYVEIQKYEEALLYLTKSLRAAEKVNDKWAMTNPLSGLGNLYVKLGDYEKAIEYFNKSVEISKEIGAKAELNEAYNYMSEAYYLQKDMANAYLYMKLYSDTKDTLFNKETSKMLVDMQTRYESEKKERQIELLNKQREQQSFLLMGITVGLVLIIIIAILMFNRSKMRKKANELLQMQKEMVEHKNQEITDSINYAKRIQQAVLRGEDDDAKSLPPHFIYFKPKDIVSGDFYWVHTIEEFCYITVADCTGHGVPGAFMSMLGIAFLNDILNDLGAIPPNEVLGILRSRIIKELSQKGDEGQPKDGMDVSLVKINLNTFEIEWAGANNPLYIITENNIDTTTIDCKVEKDKSTNKTLFEIIADKQPVGYYINMTDFTNNKIQLSKGDSIYLFSDGYADQFGGEKGKKYKYKPFKKLLLGLEHETVDFQREKLYEEFKKWKGNFDQIDDVCILGLKLV